MSGSASAFLGQLTHCRSVNTSSMKTGNKLSLPLATRPGKSGLSAPDASATAHCCAPAPVQWRYVDVTVVLQ
jgi:hypothetical protein